MSLTDFRLHHLIAFLNGWQGALDLSLAEYYRRHKSLGSKDRAEISETVYFLIRWKRLIDSRISNPTWEKRVMSLKNFDLEKQIRDETLPKAVRASFPDALYEALEGTFGEKAFEVALSLNEKAPTFIRFNPLKTDRNTLMQELKAFDPEKAKHSPLGILLNKKGALFGLESFKQGGFEMQDEASQLVALKVKAKPGDRVLDYCAGAGGKTLAFAPQMKGTGQIYLHDIRKGILFQAKKRLKRAGIQNAQILHFTEETKLDKLKGFFDWILVDAPCSGSGTYRRNPDMKEKFTKEMLERLVEEQRYIFGKAIELLKPAGKIVYATCSLFKEENQNQVDYFLNTYDLELVEPPFRSIPEKGGMDGLFAAILYRKKP